LAGFDPSTIGRFSDVDRGQDSRPAIAREWERLVDARKLHVISAWAQDVSWSDIRPLVVAA